MVGQEISQRTRDPLTKMDGWVDKTQDRNTRPKQARGQQTNLE
jgi:hypothetical protein